MTLPGAPAGGDGEDTLSVRFLVTRDDLPPTEGLRSVAGRDRDREREVLRTAPELGCPIVAPPLIVPEPATDGENGEDGTMTFMSEGEPTECIVDGDDVRIVFSLGKTGGGPPPLPALKEAR